MKSLFKRGRSTRAALLLSATAALVAGGVLQVSAAPLSQERYEPQVRIEAPASPATAVATSTPVMPCSDLAGVDLAGLEGAPTSVTSAKLVAASGSTPEYCAVTGYVAPQIQFEVRLPTQTWNGRYFQTGCGGFCGTIPIGSCTDALNANFAVAAENSGHVGSDALWALDNTDLQEDWAHRSPHVVSIAAKALIGHFYGNGPEYSYFQGCSTGGRQALMEAQRYPEDFDGIIAGNPANRQNYLPIPQGWVETVNRDTAGDLILTSQDLPLLNDAVLEACDEIDGTVDGVLDDPRQCDFDPATIQCPPGQDGDACLTAAQVDVVRKFYEGPTDSGGNTVFPGLPLGSELGWAGLAIGTDQSLSGGGNFALQVLRYLAFPVDPGAGYQLSDFDIDLDASKLDEMAEVYNSDAVDMSQFRDSGGKLVMYHGFADPLITPYSSTSYYEDVVEHSGGLDATQEWFRFFAVPGMYHCSGGPGASTVDWLGSVQAWVEEGIAPDTVTARKIEGGEVTQTRVLRPYPEAPLPQEPAGPETVERLSGFNRFATAANAALSVYPDGSDVVYIATGRAFPDALTATAAAGYEGGPVLLTEAHRLPIDTKAALEELAPSEIVVSGGPGAVSDEVLNALQELTDGTVTRISGQDRYATAAALAARFEDPGTVFVATGLDYPDALAAGAQAGALGAPVLLVRQDGVPMSTRTVLESLNPGNIVVVGGINSVSDDVMSALEAYTDGAVSRVSGEDRYETAAALSGALSTTEYAFIATGQDWPDALGAAALAGHLGAPVLLTQTDSLPVVTTAELERLRAPHVRVVGGPTVVSDDVVQELKALKYHDR